MIQLQNISKIYRTDEVETSALHQVSLHIQKGDFLAIMGPSGCGKSTLLNILGLLDAPTSGSFTFNGTETAQMNETERARLRKKNLGFVFQNFNLIDELNVFDNIELPLIYNNIPAAQRKKRVLDIMDRVNILHRQKHFPQQLSGGQQQRVAVARALVMEPALILADEPTGNLDSANGNEVMDLLTGLHKSGSTLVMVTHSQYDASFAGHIVEMRDGEILSHTPNKRSLEVFTN